MTREEAVALLERYSNYDGMGIPNLAGCKEAMKVAVESLKEAFPELRESEDERIRKVIYKLMLGMREEIFTSQDEIVTKKKVLAWLEKQKEPHYTKRNALFDKCVAECDPWIMQRVSDEIDEMLEKEQKPIYLEGYGGDVNVYSDGSISYKQKQKPVEWSEEDEDRIRQIERIAQQAGCTQKLQEEIHDWLKSLSPSWKPSEEQMTNLLRAEGRLRIEGESVLASKLAELYEQLKKL